jgi:hypothetical protein
MPGVNGLDKEEDRSNALGAQSSLVVAELETRDADAIEAERDQLRRALRERKRREDQIVGGTAQVMDESTSKTTICGLTREQLPNSQSLC